MGSWLTVSEIGTEGEYVLEYVLPVQVRISSLQLKAEEATAKKDKIVDRLIMRIEVGRLTIQRFGSNDGALTNAFLLLV